MDKHPVRTIGRRAAALLLVLGVAWFPAGCQQHKKAIVFPVEGRVTFEGEPLPGGGTIRFIPLHRKDARPAGGKIDKDGNYTLTTYKDGDGAAAAQFRVVIKQNTILQPAKYKKASADTKEGSQKPVQPAVPVPKNKLIPAIYSDPANSPLRATVEDDNNTINFDLKQNPKVDPKTKGS